MIALIAPAAIHPSPQASKPLVSLPGAVELFRNLCGSGSFAALPKPGGAYDSVGLAPSPGFTIVYCSPLVVSMTSAFVRFFFRNSSVSTRLSRAVPRVRFLLESRFFSF